MRALLEHPSTLAIAISAKTSEWGANWPSIMEAALAGPPPPPLRSRTSDVLTFFSLPSNSK